MDGSVTIRNVSYDSKSHQVVSMDQVVTMASQRADPLG